MPCVIHFTARSRHSAYVLLVALEHGLGRPLFGRNRFFGGRAMWPLDSYREVLSEHARGHHLVTSAWIVVAALMLLLVAFA
jgi:hypothetical protein